MRSKRFLIMAVIAVVAVLFCGCKNNTLDIEAENLPEGNSIDILVKIDDNDPDFCDRYKETLEEAESCLSRQFNVEYNTARRDEALKYMESKRYTYCEDGWRSAYCYCSDVHGVSLTGLDFKNSGTDKNTEEFADRFGSIKVMEIDPNGGIAHVSNEINIAPKDKFGVVKEITYDAGSGTAESTRLIYRRFKSGFSPDAIPVISGLFILPFNIFMAILLVAFSKAYKGEMTGWIFGMVFFSLPNIIFTVSYLVINLMPYLNINNYTFELEDLGGILLADAIFIMLWLLFCIRAKRNIETYTDPTKDPYAAVDIVAINRQNKDLK